MSNDRVNKSRRVLLRSTLGLGALGAALPSTWTKPIVSAVVLPTHAQMSPIPDFSVQKSQSGGPNPAMVVGDVIEYTIVVTNTGGVDLTEVVATDTLPDGSVVVLADPVESVTTNGVLEIDETWTYMTTYDVTEADIMSGAALTNSVSVAVAEDVPDQTDDVATPVVPVVCPEIVIGNVTIAPAGSGAVLCGLTFDVLSADATPLTVTGITNTPLSVDSAVTFEAFPAMVTDTTGTRVAWQGGFVSPECQLPFFSNSDVVFTVTATCEGALDPIEMEFTLTDIAAMG